MCAKPNMTEPLDQVQTVDRIKQLFFEINQTIHLFENGRLQYPNSTSIELRLTWQFMALFIAQIRSFANKDTFWEMPLPLHYHSHSAYAQNITRQIHNTFLQCWSKYTKDSQWKQKCNELTMQVCEMFQKLAALRETQLKSNRNIGIPPILDASGFFQAKM